MSVQKNKRLAKFLQAALNRDKTYYGSKLEVFLNTNHISTITSLSDRLMNTGIVAIKCRLKVLSQIIVFNIVSVKTDD